MSHDDIDRYWTYFDEAWKKIIERFFPEMLSFFVPELYADIDFSKSFVFLDKEMEQLSLQGVKGAKVVDKLVKVYLKDGREQWILVHIEVQGYADKDFSLRMFRYFYRIFDRYGKRVVSMAILTTSKAGVKEKESIELEAYGSGVRFSYLAFRLMNYDREYLKNESNPIAMVILASQEREKAHRKGELFDIKRYLIRKLYERGYEKREIIGLFEFIDWVLHLNREEEKLLWDEIKILEEEKKMPFITSVEQIGLEKGLLKEAREMVLEALNERFGDIPYKVTERINQINDRSYLKALHRHAIRCTSLEEFVEKMDK